MRRKSGLFSALVIFSSLLPATARDLGQWDKNDPITKWYGALQQPDTIGSMGGSSSCCGEADAYWADEIHVENGKVFAVVTDTRDDQPLGRPHVEPGTRFEVPPGKTTGFEQPEAARGNPTGHAVVFLSGLFWEKDKSKRNVLCFVPSGGF